LPYAEALRRFGSDKPDRRFGCELLELNALPAVANSDFPVFKNRLASGRVIGLNASGCARYTRKDIDALTELAKTYGAGGLVWVRFAEDGTVKSSVDKFFGEAQLREIGAALSAQPGDLVLIVADTTNRARKAAGALRLHLGKAEGWIDESKWDVHFVVDFPLFEQDEDTGALFPAHHPFVRLNPEDEHLFDTHPEQVRAWCYDLVMNGNELMSGSVRIHDSEQQAKIFSKLNLSAEEIEQKFGFLINAFRFGAPPHAGCAFGLDRWVMLFAGADSLREVICYPKNSAGRDLMLDAPAPVDAEQLKELGLN
jgi:aspartyl-tRNA synthetase